MSALPLAEPAGPVEPASGLASLVARGWRAMTLQHAAYTFLFCAAWSAVETISHMAHFPHLPAWTPTINNFLSMQLNGFAVMFAVLVADGASPAPSRRWWPYVPAVIAGVVLATTLFWYLSQRVFMIPGAYQPGGLPESFRTMAFRHSTSRLAICGLATYVYVCWRFAGQRVAALRTVQLERAASEKRLLETQSSYMQDRVGPKFLIDSLGQVQRLYEIDAPAADRLLKELTLYLRAAIPLPDNPASTVAREMQLTNAYLNIAGLRSQDRLVLRRDAAPMAIDAPMAPMILLPLINHALAHRAERALGDERFWIDVTVRGDRLVLTIRDGGRGFAAEGATDMAIVRIRKRLVAQHGDGARLTLSEDTEGTCAEIAIPYRPVGKGTLA
jgi:hypothetical protein